MMDQFRFWRKEKKEDNQFKSGVKEIKANKADDIQNKLNTMEEEIKMLKRENY